MKFGVRTPSLKKRIAARTSVKRMVRAKVRVPKGYGMLTNPKKAMYNKVYNKTSVSVDGLLKVPKSKPNKVSLSPVPHPTTPSVTEVNQTGRIIRTSQKALTVDSKNFESLKQQITEIYGSRVAKRKELTRAKSEYSLGMFLHVLSYLLIFGFFYKGLAKYKDDKKALVEVRQKELNELFVTLKFSDKSQLEKSWLNCIDGFDELTASEHVWDITYSEQNDRVAARTVADHSIKRTPVKIGKQKLEFIHTDLENLYLSNTNGPDFYIFPTFLILFKNYNSFSIYDLRDLDIKLTLTAYLEEEKVPGDTEIVNHTWKKANKDGSMDKRFNGNYQIPIVKYGQLNISSQSGIDEVYMFSNFSAFSQFAETVVSHVKKLSS